MRQILVVGLVGASACVPRFDLSDTATCDAVVVDWGTGLTAHVAQGDGSGEFDYDPLGDLETRTHGNYDLTSGDFWWVTEYDDLHYRDRTFYDGFGTIWQDGDMDIRADVEVTYVNAVTLQRVYERRLGCDVDKRIVSADEAEELIEVERGTYDSDVYSYERTYNDDDRTITVQGTLYDDQYRVEELDNYENGTYQLSYTQQSDITGLIRRDFVEQWHGAGSRSDGFWELAADGLSTFKYTVTGEFPDRKYNYTADFDGGGDGTVKIDGETCTVQVKNTKCTYTCGDADPVKCD